MLSLKKINFRSNNFNYYFKIILFYRNDNSYLKVNNVKKVVPKESYKWLKNNHKKRIFLIIKYKVVVKVHGVFPSNHGNSASSRRIQFH